MWQTEFWVKSLERATRQASISKASMNLLERSLLSMAFWFAFQASLSLSVTMAWQCSRSIMQPISLVSFSSLQWAAPSKPMQGPTLPALWILPLLNPSPHRTHNRNRSSLTQRIQTPYKQSSLKKRISQMVVGKAVIKWQEWSWWYLDFAAHYS